MNPAESLTQLPTLSLAPRPPEGSISTASDAATSEHALPKDVRHRPTLREDQTLFQQVVGAHGKELHGRWVLGHQNFVVGPATSDGVPFAPLCHPDGDIYLGFSGPAAAGASDVILSNRCQPGYLDALRSYGLLSDGIRVIEVDPLPTNGKPGWPYSDALARLLDPTDNRASNVAARDTLNRLISERGTPYFVSTFLSPSMREQADALGMETVQETHPALINKASFREAAARFGFQVSPGLVLETPADVDQMVTLALNGLIQRLHRGEVSSKDGLPVLWIKLQDGSGGDFVQKVSIPSSVVNDVQMRLAEGSLTLDTLHTEPHANLRVHLQGLIYNALGTVKNSLAKACEVNDYGADVLERMWPRRSLFPSEVKLICEQDARVMGTVLANCSNVVCLQQDGSYTVDAYFEQITGSDGDYRGSCPFEPRTAFGPVLESALSAQIEKVVAWMNSLGFRGRFGVDFFVVQDAAGSLQLLMTEVNGRSPISGVAKVIADKLGAPAWINVNVEAPGELNDMDDFRRIFGEYANFTPGDFSGARVIPQALRAMWGSDGLIQGSTKAKVLLVGPSLQACQKLREELSTRGFII